VGQAEYLQTELWADGGVLAITLARSDSDKNQLNVPFVAALEAAFTMARETPGLKGLVLRSAHERVFSVGADIAGEMTELDAAQARAFSQRGREVFGLLTQLPCPTVACIGGSASAAGWSWRCAATSASPRRTRGWACPRSTWASSPAGAGRSACRG
jgi:enoyl-CoA hydratase/carnithine racemase